MVVHDDASMQPGMSVLNEPAQSNAIWIESRSLISIDGNDCVSVLIGPGPSNLFLVRVRDGMGVIV